MAKILLLEDDLPLANVMLTWLESQNYVVDMVHNGEDALQILSSFQYDVLVLDWDVPGISGLGVCKAFRAKGGTTPILFLTGKSDVSNKVEGLETGADDYLCKPFEYRELGARLKSLLRRPAALLDSVLTVPGLSLDVNSKTAHVNGKSVLLTPREFGLLEFLMRHPDKAYGSKALLDAVWPLESALSEDTVRSCMRTLRKKISSDAGDCAIRTIQSQGYLVSSKPQSDD